MKTFEEVWEFTDKIPGSFTRLSAEKLFEHAQTVPYEGLIVEVGVDQGRSASVILQAAEALAPTLLLVDSWESVLIENKEKVKRLTDQFPDIMTMIWHGNSLQAVVAIPSSVRIDLIHIDAHHFDDTETGGPSRDCEAWMPLVRPGAVACFHDYNSCFPDVNIAVDKFCAGWEDLGVWDGLAIRRKP